MMEWLRKKWALLVPGKAYILGPTGVLVGGSVVPKRDLPRNIRLTSKPPNYEESWVVQWRWVGPSMVGVVLEHPLSSYIEVNISGGAPEGLGRIECSYTRVSDGREFLSNQYFIRILE